MEIGGAGEVGAKILEQILETTSVLTSPYFQRLHWVKDKIDPSDLARKRWVEGKTLDQIAVESGHGRTAVVKQFKLIRLNPELIEDRRLRKLIQ